MEKGNISILHILHIFYKETYKILDKMHLHMKPLFCPYLDPRILSILES